MFLQEEYKRTIALSLLPTEKYYGGQKQTIADQRWDQVPVRSQRLLIC